jgi:hypothetical protein
VPVCLLPMQSHSHLFMLSLQELHFPAFPTTRILRLLREMFSLRAQKAKHRIHPSPAVAGDLTCRSQCNTKTDFGSAGASLCFLYLQIPMSSSSFLLTLPLGPPHGCVNTSFPMLKHFPASHTWLNPDD